MILEALSKLLIGRVTYKVTPLDLANWVEHKIELTADGRINLGNESAFERSGYVFEEATKLVKVEGAFIFDHDIMDRFWQRGKLMLVTRSFKVYDESTIRVYPSSCRFCKNAPRTSDHARFQRLSGSCLSCTHVQGARWFSSLWTCKRGIVARGRSGWYDPVSGVVTIRDRASIQTTGW